MDDSADPAESLSAAEGVTHLVGRVQAHEDVVPFICIDRVAILRRVTSDERGNWGRERGNWGRTYSLFICCMTCCSNSAILRSFLTRLENRPTAPGALEYLISTRSLKSPKLIPHSVLPKYNTKSQPGSPSGIGVVPT